MKYRLELHLDVDDSYCILEFLWSIISQIENDMVLITKVEIEDESI